MRALILLSLIAGCTSPDDSPEATFDAVWTEFDAMYGGFDQRGVDWDAAYDTWRPVVSDADGEDSLWEGLTGLVSELDDTHVKLAAPKREVFDSNAIYRDRIGDERFDLALIEEAYLDDVHTPARVLWGTVDGDIPYLWTKYVSDDALVIEEIARAHPDAPGLIVDLRHNGGGDFTWGFAAYGLLTDEPVYTFRSRTRNGPERGTFDAWTRWEMEPTETHWDVPVTVLTDRFTVSAAERLALGLRALPDVVFVGEPTNGSIATMIGREAPNGWFYSLAPQEVEGPDGAIFEGLGIPVDIEVVNDPGAMEAGRDEALEAAIAVARRGPTLQ